MKKSKEAKNLIDSLIPLGMIFGGAIGVVFGIFFLKFLLYSIVIGAFIGYLFGIIAYGVYHKKGKS